MTHPNDAHALVLAHILALPRGSPESHTAHRDYQEVRLLEVRPKLLAQKALLERALVGGGAEFDVDVTALDAEIAGAWLALDARVAGPAVGVLP